MLTPTIELIYDPQFHEVAEVKDLSAILENAGAGCKTYAFNAYYDAQAVKDWSAIRRPPGHFWGGPSADSIFVISMTAAAFGAFFGGFFSEAGKDAWRAFKQRLGKVLLKKARGPFLEIRLKDDNLEIATECEGGKEEEIAKFLDSAVPYLLEVVASTQQKDFPEGEVAFIHLEYNPRLGKFILCEATKWLEAEKRHIRRQYNFKTKEWIRR